MMPETDISISLEMPSNCDSSELEILYSMTKDQDGCFVLEGQRNIEHLLRTLNQKIFQNNQEQLLPYLYEIFQKSIEQGVEDEGTIQWDDRSNYTRISWTGYSWKLPNEIKRRKVHFNITKADDQECSVDFMVPLSKIADDGGDILIAPRLVSVMNLKKGHRVIVRMRFVDHKNQE